MLIRPPHNQDDCAVLLSPPSLVRSWPWNSSLLIFFFVTPGRMWDVSSQSKDQTHTPLPGKPKVLTTWLPGSPWNSPLKSSWELAYRVNFSQVAGLRIKQTFLSYSLVSRGWAYKRWTWIQLTMILPKDAPLSRTAPSHMRPGLTAMHQLCLSLSSM